ncbi:Protein MraZ [Metalysinibacillus saudimassiliensis]|uniref:Transcriptional regulator MraZ n=1 Tax=Metalysinibacillus saudimassiliensis TaxID=1461583 RepID=A0A078M541_9BACL|nr:Protein MraZ [Metalysinibacillus saudimassiliensis]
MFIGEYEHTLNSKGRITMPVKFRAALGSTFIATRGPDQSLFIYTEPEWQFVINNIKQLLLMERNARALTRLFFCATALTLDKQGRIILPNYLLDYAQLTKLCTIISVGTRIEV